MQTSKKVNQQTQVFNYLGDEITFLNGDDVMINATEMAKPFNKSPWKWLELPSTKEYIYALSENRSLAESQLVTSVRGGNKPEARGNWFHEDLALEFARWLSPSFAIWCNDRIKELAKHGATAINPDSLLDPDYVIKVMTALKQEREEKRQLQVQTELQAQELVASAPKVQYYDKVMQSESLISVTQLANELGFSSAKALNKFLNANKIIRRVNNSWTLTSDYSGKGYAKYKPHVYTDSQGCQQTANHMYFTERGRKMLHEKLNQAN